MEASFVGRGDELERLESAVRAAIRGEGAGALVVGDAGVGKTRLVSELASALRRDGRRVVWSWVPEPAAARIHGHWAQVLRTVAGAIDRSDLLGDLGDDADELARLVPDLRPGLELKAAEPEGDDPRFRMYVAVASFLRRAAATQPLVVVLDDLHAADQATLRLTRFLLGETRGDALAIVGTTRAAAGEALPADIADALTELERAAPALHLSGLDRPAVDALVAAIAGADVAARSGDDIHHRSRGNPLFVGELARLLAAATSDLDHQQLPASITVLFERRLAGVPPTALAVLQAASVIGDEFALRYVERVARTSRADTLAALEAAARARLVVERGAQRYAFAHALLREVLYDQLPLAARAEAHRAFAEMLEATAPAAPPAELARHFLAGLAAVEDDKAARYAERAGQRAVEQFAYEDAARHFADALAALDAYGADTSRRAPLLLALGDASLRGGAGETARAGFMQAAELARTTGDGELLARAALGLGLDGFEVRLFDHAQLALLEEALAALAPDPSALRARLTARLSVALTFAEDGERRLALADEAIEIARNVGDTGALAYALAVRCDATAGPEHNDARWAAATEIVRLARQVGDRGMELLGRRNRFIALLEQGDIAGVDSEIAHYELAAAGISQALYQWYVPLWRGMRALMDGRIDVAWDHQRAAAALGVRAGSHNAALNADVLAWNIQRVEGQASAAADRLRQQLALADGIYGEEFWVALVLPELYPDEAAAALDRFAASRFREFPRDAVWLAAMTYAAEACGVVGHRAAAEVLDDLIRPHQQRFAVDAIGAACYGSMARPLGIVAKVRGHADEARHWFEAAVETHRACGAAGLLAQTRRDAGTATAVSKPTPPEGNVFRREGEYWTLTYGGKTARVADAKGLRDVATLLARPDREVHVADLIAAAEPADSRGARARSAVFRSSSVDPVIDDRARRAYQARLVDLRDELDEAENRGDIGRAERARAEMDAIASELAAALGLGGRARSAGDPAERARKAVTQRIRNALKRLADSHPELAAHLDRSIQTGGFCSYRPETTVDWSL